VEHDEIKPVDILLIGIYIVLVAVFSLQISVL